MTTKAPRELLNLPKRRGRPPIPPRHGPKPSPLPPAFRPIHPSHLVARQGNGFNIFVPPLRKLVFEYCERSEQSSHVRSYLLKHVEQLARSNPHVEVVVKTRTLQPPIVRGLYLTDREKVIPLQSLEHNQIISKVKILLDSSGMKMKPLKNKHVVSVTPSIRGVWSGLHVEDMYKI